MNFPLHCSFFDAKFYIFAQKSVGKVANLSEKSVGKVAN